MTQSLYHEAKQFCCWGVSSVVSDDRKSRHCYLGMQKHSHTPLTCMTM